MSGPCHRAFGDVLYTHVTVMDFTLPCAWNTPENDLTIAHPWGKERDCVELVGVRGGLKASLFHRVDREGIAVTEPAFNTPHGAEKHLVHVADSQEGRAVCLILVRREDLRRRTRSRNQREC